MSGRSELEAKREEIASICREHCVERLYIYGSAVRDDFDPVSSDYDFGVTFLPGTRRRWMGEYFALQDVLEELFSRKIDLGSLGCFKQSCIARRVQQEQELLYCKEMA